MVAAAGFVALFFRYELIVEPNGAIYRFDRWNGAAILCLPDPANVMALKCSGAVDDWQKVR